LIRDGKLYGRGSCDMKAGVTAAIFAVAALKELGYQPAHDILVQSVIGEESGGVGALTTIVKGYRADAAIILEPTRMERGSQRHRQVYGVEPGDQRLEQPTPRPLSQPAL
jgi:acetylornithine deacetylase/succinyl-diaminopimelate desuccinylase-like protein